MAAAVVAVLGYDAVVVVVGYGVADEVVELDAVALYDDGCTAWFSARVHKPTRVRIVPIRAPIRNHDGNCCNRRCRLWQQRRQMRKIESADVKERML